MFRFSTRQERGQSQREQKWSRSTCGPVVQEAQVGEPMRLLQSGMVEVEVEVVALSID